MIPFILPYKMTSLSSRLLANSLNATRIYPNRRYRGKPNHVIINWGYTGKLEIPINDAIILNHPTNIEFISDKLKFFQFNSLAKKVNAIFTIDQAKERIAYYGNHIYCRTLTRAKGGDGIVLAHTLDELVQAPLYTIKAKGTEFRLHVFKDKVFHIQQKRKMSDEKLEENGIEFRTGIRNYNNGWVFTINDLDEIRQETIDNAILCVKEYGLDFGAVDIIQNEEGSRILEINSAPGLEGTTLSKYKEQFSNYLSSL